MELSRCVVEIARTDVRPALSLIVRSCPSAKPRGDNTAMMPSHDCPSADDQAQQSIGAAAEVLSQLRGQIFGPKVRVPFQHGERLVARNGRHLDHVQPPLKERGSRFVPQVVQPDID